MPLQFSVMEKHPTIKSGPNAIEFVPVPKDVAETHEKGCYALFNDEGEQVSVWTLLNPVTDVYGPSKRTTAVDAIKQPLVVGDYVAYNDAANSPVQIAKVVGFTNKQVRIQKLGNPHYNHAYSRLLYEASLVKLPESFWQGSL